MSFEENGEGEVSKMDIEGNIEAISNRKNPMKVLMFLLKSDKLFYTTEIAEELDMNYYTVEANLYKLNDAGLIEIVKNDVDKRLKLWKIVDKVSSEKAIVLYKKKVGYKLAHLIPNSKVSIEDLKKDKRFTEACADYGLTLSEGINAVMSCPKVANERRGEIVFLWRAEQGYIPPKGVLEVEEIE